MGLGGEKVGAERLSRDRAEGERADGDLYGDGAIDIRAIRAMVEGAGFAGLNEVEIFSALDWWRLDGDEVLATVVERGRTVC